MKNKNATSNNWRRVNLVHRFRKYEKLFAYILLPAVVHLFVGCHYYKVGYTADQATIKEEIQNKGKYIILHQGSNAWHLKDLTLNDEKQEMYGTIEALPEGHKYYRNTNPNGNNRYKPREGDPTYEVHIYIMEMATGAQSNVTVPLSSIKKIELYDKAMGATVASYVFSTLGILAGVAVILGIIIILTKSSCPFIYIHDGQTYRFTGEMYGGAIYPSLERDDYMPLPGFSPKDGFYDLKIANELLEKQYTDLAQLMVIEHLPDTRVLIDRNGNYQTLSRLQAPLSALSGQLADITKSLLVKDSNVYMFSDAGISNPSFSNMQLTFSKPADAKTGKLVINAKNSFWLDYIYGKFNEQFGTYYNTFAKKQARVSAEKNQKWAMEQGIPLSVYLETDKGWKLMDYFNVIGPLADRDMVMPIDLSDVKGDKVRLKIECGFMFWEMDYAAMDFTANSEVSINTLSPSSAIDETGRDVSSLLFATDHLYLTQPAPGNAAVVKYKFTPASVGKTQTVFLHSRGYYEYIRDYKGKPDFVYLNSFRKKGAFTTFSKQHYLEYSQRPNLFVNALNN